MLPQRSIISGLFLCCWGDNCSFQWSFCESSKMCVHVSCQPRVGALCCPTPRHSLLQNAAVCCARCITVTASWQAWWHCMASVHAAARRELPLCGHEVLDFVCGELSMRVLCFGALSAFPGAALHTTNST